MIRSHRNRGGDTHRRGVSRVASVVSAALAATVAIAGPAWAPSTSDSRFIKITASTANGAVGELNVSLQLDVETCGRVGTICAEVSNRLTEFRPSDRSDRSVAGVILHDATGAPLAELSVGLDVLATPRRDVRTQTAVDSSYDPEPTGRAQPVDEPEARFRRQWHSDIRDSSGRVVVAGDVRLDERLRASSDGIRVQQNISSRDERSVTIQLFIFEESADIPAAEGTITLTAEQLTLSSYESGPTTVRDDDQI